MTTHVIRVACADEAGLVHKITGVLYRHGGNIVSYNEYVDAPTKQFFMRATFVTAQEAGAIVPEVRALLARGAMVELAPTGKRPIVVLATKEPHCLGDLLLRVAYEDFPAKILAVISNYETLGPLVERLGFPFHYISHENRDRADHEREIHACVAGYKPDYLVLAKYMRILSPEFVARYPNRILNIHHSFLPAFMGASPYRQAYERGVKLIGATAHYVTNDLDTGPIIAQAVIPVDHADSVADMVQAGRDGEKVVLARALKLLLEERIFLHQHRTVIFE